VAATTAIADAKTAEPIRRLSVRRQR
jgi:hypothetical protein